MEKHQLQSSTNRARPAPFDWWLPAGYQWERWLMITDPTTDVYTYDSHTDLWHFISHKQSISLLTCSVQLCAVLYVCKCSMLLSSWNIATWWMHDCDHSPAEIPPDVRRMHEEIEQWEVYENISLCYHWSWEKNNINECTEVQNPRRGYSWPLITIIRMRAFRRKMADRMYVFQWRECWISATERFQRKPHKFFDVRCTLSTWQYFQDEQLLQRWDVT